jgi:hypothetical protein
MAFSFIIVEGVSGKGDKSHFIAFENTGIKVCDYVFARISVLEQQN